MKFWKNENEPIEMFLTLFNKAKEDKEVGPSIRKLNQLIWFDYTQSGPNCSFWADTRGGEVIIASGKPADKPDLIMSLSADDAHRSWLNKLNPVIAITRKKIVVKGSAIGLFRLASKLKKIAVIYEEVLKEAGKENIIL